MHLGGRPPFAPVDPLDELPRRVPTPSRDRKLVVAVHHRALVFAVLMGRRPASRPLGGRLCAGRAGLTTALASLAAALGCSGFDTSRDTAPRGTLGTGLYSLICDRVGAQALREDITGNSYHSICHPDAAGGTYGQSVDTTILPPLTDGAVDVDGNPVSMATQQANRAHNIARIEALGRDRASVIAALDSTIPDIQIAAKDLTNADATLSCGPTPGGGTGPLHGDLARTVGNLTDLYDDRTIPLLTEAIGHVLDAIKQSPDAQSALSRMDARQGYRPSQIALGVAQPILAYPQLVDLTNTLLSLLASDSNPYSAGLFDPTGAPPSGRTPVPGAASGQFQQLLRVLREEMRTETPSVPVPPLASAQDTNDPTRTIYTRPLDDLEITRGILFPSLSATPPSVFLSSQPLVLRDPRGVALVSRMNGAIPPPFVDSDGDGLADLDTLRNFVTVDGSPVPSPFFSIDGINGPRQNGLAVNGAAPMYGYVDTGSTLLAKVTSDIVPLLAPAPGPHGEALVQGIAGALPLLFGKKDAGPTSQKTYFPDPTAPQTWALQHPGVAAPATLATTPVILPYAGYHAETSPLADLVYAVGQVLADPTTDDTLSLFRQIATNNPQQLARLVGVGLQIKAIANLHPEAHIPKASTLWDELLDAFAAIAHVYDAKTGGILEDLISAFGTDQTLALKDAFTAYIDYKDVLTYQNAQRAPATGAPDLNGPAFNLSTGGVTPMMIPVDRTQPDSGDNRSELQRFMQLLHDANGLGACTKAGAVAHLNFPVIGNIDYPSVAADAACVTFGGGNIPPNPMPACGILRIPNVAKLLLDVALGRAKFDVPDPCLNALLNNTAITGLVGGPDAFLEAQSGITGFDLHPTVAGVSRLVYYDTPHDADPGDPSFPTTEKFLSGVLDPIPSMACDPTPFTASDGTVIPLRTCSSFDLTLRGRDPGGLFPLEQLGFIQNVQPLAAAFDDHGQPLLFVQLFDTLQLHWGSPAQTKAECDPTLPRSNARWCSHDGAVTYEPLLSEALKTDLFAALHDFIPVLKQTTVAHCTAQDPKTGQCTASLQYDGVHVLSEAVRALVDPARAAALGLKDRHGSTSVARNDGTTNAQVTPIYLLIDALNGMDQAFASYETNGGDPTKHPAWLSARSQIVDTFFSVDGTGTSATWTNPLVPRLITSLIDTLRGDLAANCPTARLDGLCPWARANLTQKVTTTVNGPMFAAIIDLLDAIRASPEARTGLESLAQYLLGPGSPVARQATLTALHDILQVFEDETNLSPLVNALAEGTGATLVNDSGVIVRRPAADALVEVLRRVLARAYDAQGREICSDEIDPNRAFATVLQHLVAPLATTQPTAIEMLVDAIADVNRAHPEVPFATQLGADDYGSIAAELSDFLENDESGLEQVYTVIKQATSGG